MKRILVIFLAAAAAAQAQGGAVSPPSQLPQGRTGMPASMAVQPAPMAHPEAVGANEPVITVHGFCPEDSRPAAACSTVITKAQFEKIMAAVNQSGAPMPAVAVRNLAERYVQMLAFARAAEKLGLDKDPKFQELMRFVRLNNLTEAYRRAVNDQNKLPSDADVQAYYASNIAKFEQVRLSRIFVPRVNPKAPREQDRVHQARPLEATAKHKRKTKE